MTSWNGNISALLLLCAGNSPVTSEFPAQRSVTRNFDAFFDLHPNKRLSKQSWGYNLRRYRAHYDVTVTVRYEITLHIMGKWDYAKFVFKKSFSGIFYIVTKTLPNVTTTADITMTT